MKLIIDHESLIIKLLKFGIVGFSGILVDYAFTFLFKEYAGLNKYIANSIGFITAATTNYLLNRIWTFKSTNPNVAKEYVIFIFISALGLAINNLIIWLLSDVIYTINFYVAKFFAIVIVFFWNFIMNHLFNFKTDSSLEK